MPLTMNVGITKKHGLPDFGSVGASCHVTVELDASVLERDLDSFQRHVRHAYVACSQAVNDELARQRQGNGHASHGELQTRDGTGTVPGNGAHNGTHNGTRSGASSHQASSKQLGYLRQLAGQVQNLGDRGLAELSERLFEKPVAELSSFDASSLIDTLKAIKAGKLGLDATLSGARV